MPQESHDPRKEELDVFEARINRAAKGLLMLGIEVAERQEEVLLEASAIKEVSGTTTSLTRLRWSVWLETSSSHPRPGAAESRPGLRV